MMGGGEVTSREKAVFFRTQQGLGYGYGAKFRDPKVSNLDKCILRANGKFGARRQRNVLGIISMHVGGLLIPGIDFYRKHFQQNSESEVDSYEGNKAAYLGMWGWKSGYR